MVVEGKVSLAFTDTDDAYVAILAGKPVKIIYPDSTGIGTFLIPNTVGLIMSCPHPAEGKRLIDYLLSKEVEKTLAASESANMPLRDGVEKPAHVPVFSSIKTMTVDYGQVAKQMEKAALFNQSLFIR
jgi:iron(III) transport system substrate-binding protein